MAQYKAHAKVNLFLEVGDKRSDGRHNIQTVFCTLGLHDKVTFKESKDKGFHIRGFNGLKIPKKENIIYKAAAKLAARGNIDLEGENIAVEVEKNIPLSSGLGGSATDAAPVLAALNRRWELGLSEIELHTIASSVGADAVVALHALKKPGIFVGEGTGDRITRAEDLPLMHVLIAVPSHYFKEDKTKTLYELMDTIDRTRLKVNGMLKQIAAGDWQGVCDHFYNGFERPAFEAYPQIEVIKKKMEQEGALGTLMSGAGGSVFGIFESQTELVDASAGLESMEEEGIIKQIIRTTTICKNPETA